jgi:hypothetical protein
MSKYLQFDIQQLEVLPITDRESKLSVDDLLVPPKYARSVKDVSDEMLTLTQRIRVARRYKRPIVWFVGGHVIKRGLGLYLIELMKKGFITHLAGNGSVMIHDFELAYHGATSESVPKYLQEGQFGLWSDMKVLNALIGRSSYDLLGLGEGVGQSIRQNEYPYRRKSVLAQAYDLSVPATIHPMVGGDINHMLLNHQGGASLGATAHRDFMIFAHSIKEAQKKGGVFLNVGSAVHGPEVFLKALSMARNVLEKRKAMTTAVFDMLPVPDNWREDDSNASYYMRSFKTVLNRAVDGKPRGSSYYIQGDHVDTIPKLWKALNRDN